MFFGIFWEGAAHHPVFAKVLALAEEGLLSLRPFLTTSSEIPLLRVLVLKSAGGLPRLGSRYNVDL
jgi:hypothetical protein